jgi:CubicO group peptidase (beta-lactamase class C family)
MTWYQAQIDAGELPGALVAIARNDELVYLRALGYQDRARKTSMRPDAIFWIASMTKPVTSVAAMMLVEQGKLDLDAPVDQYLPELKDMKVAVEKTDPATGKTELMLEPQQRPMLVLDLISPRRPPGAGQIGTARGALGCGDSRRAAPWKS